MAYKQVFLVFGGTGDLMRRKLTPAFLSLMYSREIAVVGIGRRDFNDESYKEFLATSLSEEKKIEVFAAPIFYFKADLEGSGFLSELPAFLDFKSIKSESVFCYLATDPKFFSTIVRALSRSGIPQDSMRLMFEKPFGSSGLEFIELDKMIKAYYSEDKIYRVDHYLAKDTVQNIAALRFANPLLEQIFRSECIKEIEVVVDEELGVGNRLGYYHETGALKDMIQGHLLQVLALLLMEEPKSLEAKDVHDSKVSALRQISPLPANQQFFGQYSSYTEEVRGQGLKERKTETFCRIALEYRKKGWEQTKIFLRTGKKLGKKYGQIRIKLKEPEGEIKKAFPGAVTNEIIIDIYPKQDVRLVVNSRVPGKKNGIAPVSFNFIGEHEFGPNTVDEYSSLLSEALEGQKILFARADELEACWNIVDSLETMRSEIPFVIYEDGQDPEKIN